MKYETANRDLLPAVAAEAGDEVLEAVDVGEEAVDVGVDVEGDDGSTPSFRVFGAKSAPRCSRS